MFNVSLIRCSVFFFPHSQFQLDPDGGFYDDYVEIYSPDVNGQLQGRWYGSNAPTNLTHQSGFWVKFRSNDDEFKGQGFRAQWSHGN